jgi:hypothetical protein
MRIAKGKKKKKIFKGRIKGAEKISQKTLHRYTLNEREVRRKGLSEAQMREADDEV